MLVLITKGCTFTVQENGRVVRMREKPGAILELPDETADQLAQDGLARPADAAATHVADEPGMPVADAAGPFAAMPVEQPGEFAEAEAVAPANRFAPPRERPGGLRSLIRQPR